MDGAKGGNISESIRPLVLADSSQKSPAFAENAIGWTTGPSSKILHALPDTKVGFPRIIFAAMAATFFLTVAKAQQPAPTLVDPVLNPASMDPHVDPCVDFYTYSCGGWKRRNPIPPDQSSWAAWDKMQDENTFRMREILEEAASGGAKRNAINQKIGDYYAACMDEKAVEAVKQYRFKAATLQGKPVPVEVNIEVNFRIY